MDNEQENRKPRVSIIIPCFNYSHFIPDTLRSLQQQVFTNWECWLVDDGSTDSTAAVVKEIAATDARINYLYQPNAGQPAARNTGLKHARAGYIQFLDADDVLQPLKFVEQVSYLDTHAATDIVYGSVRYFKQYPPVELFINRWDNHMQEWMPGTSGKGFPLVKALVQQNIFELGCALFRKTATDAIGLFNTQLKGVEDYDYCFRAVVKGLCFTYLDKKDSYCLMRHHPDSFSKGLLHMYKKELQLRSQMEEKLKPIGDKELLLLNKRHYSLRLKKLQNLIIDYTIKGIQSPVDFQEIRWMFTNSSPKQNWYFFPRLLKAKLLR